MNKFLMLLSTLSHKSLKRFGDFISSPYFNKNEVMKSFVMHQIDAIIKNANNELADEKLFNVVYPNESYNRDRLYRLRSECLILLEKFIIYEQVKSEEGIAYLSLLYYYAQNDLPNHFEAGHKIWAAKKEDRLIDDADYYYYAFKEEQLIGFYITQKQERRRRRRSEIKVDLSQSTNLDAFYYINVLEKLIYLWETGFTMKNMLGMGELSFKTEEVIKRIEEIPHLSDNVLLKYYMLSLKILKNQDDVTYFNDFWLFLKENHDALPMYKLQNGYAQLNNFCIRHTNLGNAQYDKTLFDLYQYQLKKGLLYNSKGNLTVSSLTNIITIALKANKEEWANNFLANNRTKLTTEDPNMVYQYCCAKICFEQHKYGEAKKMFLQIKINDLIISINVRRYILKCCYETEDISMLTNELDNFRAFAFRQNWVAEKQKDKNKKFYSVFKKIVDYSPQEATKKTKILDYINKHPDIADRLWLLEKFNQLK